VPAGIAWNGLGHGPRETLAARVQRDKIPMCITVCLEVRSRALGNRQTCAPCWPASPGSATDGARLSRALVSEQAWTACRRRSRAFARCRRRPRTTTRRSTCCTSGAKLTRTPRGPGASQGTYGLRFPASRAGCYRWHRAACRQGLHRTVRTEYAYQPRASGTYRGTVAPQVGRTAEAAAGFRAAVSVQPDGAEAYYNLGIAYKDQGRHHDSLDAYDAALALRPTFPEARSDAGLHISPVSPMYLPYISPIPHLYLAYISHLPRGALQRRRSLTLASNASL
jgi:hypothetical protein